jgi:hypothetical protein
LPFFVKKYNKWVSEVPMISLVEVADRMRSGTRMGDKEWSMALFQKITQLVKEYDIHCPTETSEWQNTDNSLAHPLSNRNK